MKILKGTYGFDLLSLFLLFISAILNPFPIARLVGLFLLIIVVYRAFSKNTYKRSQELYKFTSFINNKILYRFGKTLPNIPHSSLESIPLSFRYLGNSIKQKFKYKILVCPRCNQKLRVPRGKKKIIVTCKSCHNEFKAKS